MYEWLPILKNKDMFRNILQKEQVFLPQFLPLLLTTVLVDNIKIPNIVGICSGAAREEKDGGRKCLL